MSDDSGPHGGSIDADLDAIVQFMGRMMRGIKGSGGHHETHEIFRHVRAAGLGRRHLPVLVSLAQHGPSPVGVLAAHMALNPATASQLVGELQRAGFVERHPDERDRRRMIVSLDETHRTVIERFTRRRLDPLRLTLEALTPQERAHFILGWRTLVENMERSAAEEGPDGGDDGDGDAVPPCG